MKHYLLLMILQTDLHKIKKLLKMKKLIFLFLLLLPLLSEAQTVRKIGPMEILDYGTDSTAEWTNRNLMSEKMTADTITVIGTLDIAGPITKEGIALDSFYIGRDAQGRSKIGALYSIPQSPTDTIIDWGAGNIFYKTPVAPIEYDFINVTAGQIITVVIKPPAPGAGIVTFTDANIYWVAGTPPESSVERDVYTFLAISPTEIYAIGITNFQLVP